MNDTLASLALSGASSGAASRRERVRDYKRAFPSMGIYAVRCTASGEVWLGRSRNVEGTLNRVQFELRQGAPRNVRLRQTWAQHGVGAFSFEVLDRVKQRDDPLFDYEAELDTLLQLWQAELGDAVAGELA